MSNQLPIDTPTPEPFYACMADGCAEEISNPAENMYWATTEYGTGWHCEDCISCGGFDVVMGERHDDFLKRKGNHEL